jgi:MinD-like ATPase involved in chromosome partitioning or flagellar assembly
MKGSNWQAALLGKLGVAAEKRGGKAAAHQRSEPQRSGSAPPPLPRSDGPRPQGYPAPPVARGAGSAWVDPGQPAGPGAHAYAPAYHDPLAGTLPVAAGPVGLHHDGDQSGRGGLLRRIGRFAAEAAYIAGASGRMQRDVDNIATIRRPIGIGRTIGIISPVPASGSSVVAALVTDALAAQRSSGVLAIDADPRAGKLARRLPADATTSRIHLAVAEPTADGVQSALAHRAAAGVGRLPLSLIDCPAGIYEPATAYVASSAHAIGLVVPAVRDAVWFSMHELDRLAPEGQRLFAARGVFVIAETRPGDAGLVQWLQSAASTRGLTHVVLPYDEHLATAWPLRPDRLKPATRRSVLELTARLVERATTT